MSDFDGWQRLEDAGAREPGCPKRMVFGPCGGVRPDEQCELSDHRCPFVDRDVVAWAPSASGATVRPTPDIVSSLGAVTPIVVIDLHVRPLDATSVRAVTARLAGVSDAVLVGEHQARPGLPPVLAAALVTEAGGRPWVTLSGRDRNRVVLEAELAGLAELGVPGVHCVTGDGRGQGVRGDATQVFDLDGTRLTALAQAIGLCASVAASPLAPPVDRRPARLLEKERAGARACFVNHSGGPEAVARFVAAARSLGVVMPFVPCVAVATDAQSLAVLERFPGVVVDERVRQAAMGTSDGREAGIVAAVAEAQRMLSIEGVAGVNLSGAATSDELESAAIMAEVAVRLRERVATG